MENQTAAAPAEAKPAAKAAPIIHTQLMDDGRTVDFPGNRRLQKEVMVEGDKVKVRLDFVNGETRTVTLNPKLLYKSAGHGLSQKLGDEISGVKDLDDAILAIDELSTRLDGGEWNEGTSGGEGVAGASILMRALIEVSGKSKQETKDFLATLTPKEKLAMREAAGVREVVLRLEAEKAAKAKPEEKTKVDVSAKLASLLGPKPAAVTSIFPPAALPASGPLPSEGPAGAGAQTQPAADSSPQGAAGATVPGSTPVPAVVVGKPDAGKSAPALKAKAK